MSITYSFLHVVIIDLCLCVFKGIITDLFPGVILPKPDYELLLKALDDNIAKMKLQPVPWFIGKIIQVQNLLNTISSI